jgi:anti-sigma factor RsiW
MNPIELKTHLMPYADGELDPELRAQVDAALAQSPELREELAEIQRISAFSHAAAFASAENVSFAGLYDGVMARIAAEAKVVAPAKPGVWARFTAWCGEVVRFERPLVAAGFAAAALAAVIGISMSGGAGAPTATPTVANGPEKDLRPRRGAEEEVKMLGKNNAFVESLEAQKGKAYVEFDKNDPEAPMVLWHVIEDEGAPAPKGL